jgi:hypothetical protein
LTLQHSTGQGDYRVANDAAMVTTVRSAHTVAQPKVCHVIKAGAGWDNWSAASPDGQRQQGSHLYLNFREPQSGNNART